MLTHIDRAVLAASAKDALAALDITAVRLEDVVEGGSWRSVVVRAVAEPRLGQPLPIVIKAAVGETDGFVRERAALSLIRDHGLPGAVRLLGVCDDPPLLVLEDLGDGPSVAGLLLGNDPLAAERAVTDWGVTVGTLQAASTGLGDEFRTRLATATRAGAPLGRNPPATAAVATATDLLAEWLEQTAASLAALLRRFGLRPTPAAVGELRSVMGAMDPLGASGAGGLVPGDTCPDNALYVAGRLTLIDFEAAAHRHVAWEAASLIVPWPTCWCSWALPEQVTTRALAAWRQAVAPSVPAVTSDAFDDDLAMAAIAWALVSVVTFLLPRAAAAESAPDSGSAPRPSSPDPPQPDRRSLVLHRLKLAAEYPTVVLPALRDLARLLHDACVHRWGQRSLDLAPAFRP
jgi:hypothetical protein